MLDLRTGGQRSRLHDLVTVCLGERNGLLGVRPRCLVAVAPVAGQIDGGREDLCAEAWLRGGLVGGAASEVVRDPQVVDGAGDATELLEDVLPSLDSLPGGRTCRPRAASSPGPCKAAKQ